MKIHIIQHWSIEYHDATMESGEFALEYPPETTLEELCEAEFFEKRPTGPAHSPQQKHRSNTDKLTIRVAFERFVPKGEE